MSLSLPRPARLSRRLLLAPAILATSLLAGAFAPHAAHAAMGVGCDPIVVLSNGRTIQMAATIGVTDPSVIGSIPWQLHAPVGTSVVSVTYNDGVSAKEKLQFTADQPAGTYQTSVMVKASVNGASVTSINYAYLTSDTLGNQAPDATSSSGTGVTGTPVTTTLRHA